MHLQDKILKVIDSAIPSDNPIGELTELMTLHLISNVDNADGAAITGVATALQNAVCTYLILFRQCSLCGFV